MRFRLEGLGASDCDAVRPHLIRSGRRFFPFSSVEDYKASWRVTIGPSRHYTLVFTAFVFMQASRTRREVLRLPSTHLTAKMSFQEVGGGVCGVDDSVFSVCASVFSWETCSTFGVQGAV